MKQNTYQVSEAFIKEAYESAGDITKARLRTQFPELFGPRLAKINSNSKIGSNTCVESNDFNPFFVGEGVVSDKLLQYKQHCIVPCEGYSVQLVPNTGGSKNFPTLVVFTKD